tara:strand:+ start:352 stop:468 length:117 start_codon:yes stop_codon:yes gene_type:complete
LEIQELANEMLDEEDYQLETYSPPKGLHRSNVSFGEIS